MLKAFSCIIFLFVISGHCQTWDSRACLVGHNVYYRKVMQEVFTQIEQDVKWCNMKMDNRGQNVNEQLFKWNPIGTVNYTNGFVVSIEKIDLTNVESLVTTNINNVTVQIVRGRVNLRELNVGFDVIANLEDSGTHRFTGTYSHTAVIFQTSITRNVTSDEMITAASVVSTSAGNHIHMIYRPANNITEMLSRRFAASDNENSYSRWAREVIAPRMQEFVKTIDFPTVRFDGRC